MPKPTPNPKINRPNIIFIMTDDQGPWAFGSAPDVNAHTPNIDRLCSEGTRLIRYFVTTPVCSPSRASLMTSRYSTEVNIPDYIRGDDNKLGLETSLATWPKLLADAGYSTTLIGKWHLGRLDEHHPTKHGYQEFKGFRVGGSISENPKVEVDGKVRRIEGYTPDILTDFALDYVRRHKDKPFLMSLHFWAPHANTDNRTPDGDRTWLPLSDADWKQFKDSDPVLPEPDYPKLDTSRVKRMMREYLGSVASVDRNLGRLLKLLDELKLTENTIVIFTSDNGFNMGHNGIWHKGNGRWILIDNQEGRPNMYDNSLMVPAVIRWPSVIPNKKTIDKTISNLDWFPTILAMAGVSLPGGTVIRGRNFLPLIKGDSISWDNDIFNQYSMWPGNQTGAIMRSYRTPQWKFIRDFKHKGKDELYDLTADSTENRNLINSSDPAVQKKRRWLNQKLLERMKRINDPVLALDSAG
jgi:choline-sulfatase